MTLFPRRLIAALLAALPLLAAAQPANPDWPNLARYRDANTALGAPAAGQPRIVFMGDSITEFWNASDAAMFANPSRINRGISGQTSSQMLVRFRADVIALQPRAVVILAGTNDIAGNTGPVSEATIAGHLASMAELARVHGIRVVFVSVLPAKRYYWSPEQRPAARIQALNTRLQAYAREHGFPYVDLHTPMADDEQGLKPEYGEDGVHPNAAGYRVMRAALEPVLAEVLKRP